MNRLQYWLVAKSQYNLHSPAIFDLYNEVLNARVNRRLGVSGRTLQLIYMLVNYYHLNNIVCPWLQSISIEEVERVVRMANPNARMVNGEGRSCDMYILECGQAVEDVKMSEKGVVLVINPHKDELWWEEIYTKLGARVSIDMFDRGILLFNAKLHPQKFILR